VLDFSLVPIVGKRRRGLALAIAVAAITPSAFADDDDASVTMLPTIEIRIPAPPTAHAVVDPASGLMIPAMFITPSEPSHGGSSTATATDSDSRPLELVLDPATGLLVPSPTHDRRHGRAIARASTASDSTAGSMHIDPTTGLMIPRFDEAASEPPTRSATTRSGASRVRAGAPAECRRGATLGLDPTTGLMVPCTFVAAARH
jgi:hypothetical protein